MKKIESIVLKKNCMSILLDHGLESVPVNDFIHRQNIAVSEFQPNNSKHAIVTLVKDLSSGLLFVKKIFGLRKKIPYNVAKELAVDYLIHQTRLQNIGIKVAPSYEITLSRIGDFCLISLYQLFFPEKTLSETILDSKITSEMFNEVIKSSIRDTVLPCLKYSYQNIDESESFIFLDSAPRNVAPLNVLGSYCVFYFDLFVPRIRNEDGMVKKYKGFNPHIRSEEEMVKRFFTKAGILQNFLVKMKRELIYEEYIWKEFSIIAEQELDQYIKRYFPNMTINEITELKLA